MEVAPNSASNDSKLVWEKIVSAISRISWPTFSVLLMLGLWDVGVRVFDIRPYLLPSPGAIIQEMIASNSTLWEHSQVTAFETLAGFALSIVVGIPLGIAIAYSPIFEKTLYPLLISSQTIPKTAIAPLFLIWLGFGLLPKIIIAFLIAVFPVIVNTVVGLKSVDSEMILLAKSMGASRFRTFWKIRLPYALPSIMGGLKIATTLAVVGAIVGEFVGANVGLGYLLVYSIGILNTRLLFAALVSASILGIVLFGIVHVAESYLIPWHVSKREEEVATTTM